MVIYFLFMVWKFIKKSIYFQLWFNLESLPSCFSTNSTFPKTFSPEVSIKRNFPNLQIFFSQTWLRFHFVCKQTTDHKVRRSTSFSFSILHQAMTFYLSEVMSNLLMKIGNLWSCFFIFMAFTLRRHLVVFWPTKEWIDSQLYQIYT